jgi:hypothetical protein
MKRLNEQLRKIWNLISLMEGTDWDKLTEFLKQENIEFKKIDWIGSGEYGNAYSLGNGQVLKITNSENEFDLAKQIKNTPLPGLVKIYDFGWYRDEKPKLYYILMDELDTDSSIEDMFQKVEMILTTQGLDISQTSSFDEDEYDGSEGELDQETIKFMNDLGRIYRSCSELGIRAPDVNYGNLGYDRSGNVTLFDVQDRSAMRNRMW